MDQLILLVPAGYGGPVRVAAHEQKLADLLVRPGTRDVDGA